MQLIALVMAFLGLAIPLFAFLYFANLNRPGFHGGRLV